MTPIEKEIHKHLWDPDKLIMIPIFDKTHQSKLAETENFIGEKIYLEVKAKIFHNLHWKEPINMDVLWYMRKPGTEL